MDDYYALINPTHIATNFKTMLEFKSYCETRSTEVLKSMLIDYEREEMYLHCHEIKKVLDKRLRVKK